MTSINETEGYEEYENLEINIKLIDLSLRRLLFFLKKKLDTNQI
jgi:hypothetical protein